MDRHSQGHEGANANPAKQNRRRRRIAGSTFAFFVVGALLAGAYGATAEGRTPLSHASDSFSRHVAAGWGGATQGGVYKLSGTQANFGVNGSVGKMTLPKPGVARSATLTRVSLRDVDVQFRMLFSRPATGSGESVWAVARDSGVGNQYRVGVVVSRGGILNTLVARVLNGQRTFVGSSSPVASVRPSTSRYLVVRVQVYGTNPTVLRIKVWPAASQEPAAWTRTVRDPGTRIAAAGAVGVRASLSANTTNTPVKVLVDNLAVKEHAANQAPTPTPAALRVLYISTAGNDANPGTIGQPWRTLQKAANGALPGDLINVRAGTYAGFSMRSRSGTSANPIVFQGYPGDARPVLDGQDAVVWVVNLSSLHSVQVLGFEVTGGRQTGQDGGGILVNASSDVLVAHNVLHDNSAYGVRAYNATDVTIANNDIYGNGEGVDVRHKGDGVKILNNDIHNQDRGMVATPTSVNAHDDTGSIGVAFVFSTGNVLAQGNRIWGNRWNSYDYGWDGGGFEIYGASNVTMNGNILWDSDDVIETGSDSAVACVNNVFTRNISYDNNPNTKSVGMILRCAKDMVVANNTFFNLDYWVFDINNYSMYSDSVDGLAIENNITSMNNGKIYAVGTGVPSSVAIDNNLDYNPGNLVAEIDGKGRASTTAQFVSLGGYQTHGVNAAPGFVDVGNMDFHLASTSAAVDRGRLLGSVTDGFHGSAPDIGRFER